MILIRIYDDANKVDRAWYNSSNIVYSECDDKQDDFKTLRVTFKNGSTYQYNKVDVNDYLMFLHGGLDGSNGKALNRFIKPKCEYERLSDKNVTDLLKEAEKLLKSKEITQEIND